VAKRERPKLIVAGATAYSRLIEPEPFREIRRRRRGPAHVRYRPPGRACRRRSPPEPCGVGRRGHLHDPQDLAGAAAAEPSCVGPIWPRPSTRPCSRVSRGDRSSTSSRPRRWRFAKRGPSRRSASTPAAVVANARALGEAARALREGFRLVSGGTGQPSAPHRPAVPSMRTLTGKEAQEVLDQSGITLNRNTIPDDPRSPLRDLGTAVSEARRRRRAGMGRR